VACLEWGGLFETISIFLHAYQIRLTHPRSITCQTHGMDMSKMTRQEIEALLRLLAEMEQSRWMPLLLERREAEREGGCANNQPPK